MKSGKFTAAQNKSEQGEYIDSISEFVALCEKDGFIPRYYVDGPQDKVDRVIEDMKFYTRTLVTEEMGLGNLIENAIQHLETQGKESDFSEEESEEDKLFNYDDNSAVTDEDFKDFFDWEEEQENAPEITEKEVEKIISEADKKEAEEIKSFFAFTGKEK